MDFSKAFDRVPHSLLWERLINDGVHGRILIIIRNMYKTLRSCVKTREGLTGFFPCKIETRQGCMLSPFLFTIYLNELILELRNEGENGVFINENIGYIQTLVYADDLVCVADTVGNLQKQVNIIQNYCKNWGTKVNLDKTKLLYSETEVLVDKMNSGFMRVKK